MIRKTAMTYDEQVIRVVKDAEAIVTRIENMRKKNASKILADRLKEWQQATKDAIAELEKLLDTPSQS